MLKGKSKIELFDAATGAKLTEQRNSNLVTDALNVIANCKDKTGLLRWWNSMGSDGGTDLSKLNEYHEVCPSRAMLPLYKKALGGILLWDGNIAEDPSIMMPPANVSEVGHAGDAYSGANIYRGSYNSNESGKISGGYRHVWDFDTDKANGVIKCLSLTSRHGGNMGWHGCYETDNYPMINFCYFHSENRYLECTERNSIAFEGDGEAGFMLYIRKMEDGTLRIYKRNGTAIWYSKAPDPTKISLFTTKITCTEKVTLPITLVNGHSSVFFYKGVLHEIARLNTTQLQHRTFNLDGAQLSIKTLNLPFSLSTTPQYYTTVYRDGYYYCFPHTSTDLVKMDEEGREVKRIQALQNMDDIVKSVIVNDLTGEIMFTTRPAKDTFNLHIAHTLNTNDTVSTLNCMYYMPVRQTADDNNTFSHYVKTDDPGSPFLFYNIAQSGNIIPLVNMGYLATINNLQSPITKTSAQTMKITYEIYDE